MNDEHRGLPTIDEAMAKKHYEAQVSAMVQQLQLVALPFAPERFRDLKRLTDMAEYLIREQTQYMQTVIPAMINPQEGYPEVEMYVWRAGTGPEMLKPQTDLRLVQEDGDLPAPSTTPDFTGADPAILDCPKRLEGLEDPMQAMCQALCYSFLMNPACRATLRMNGWLYYFTQKKHGPADA